MLETLQHLFHKQHKFSVYNKYDKKKSHLLCTFIDYKIELMDEKKMKSNFQDGTIFQQNIQHTMYIKP